MGWIEIVIEIALEQAEALSDALMELGALSVSVEDADEGTEAEQALFGEPGMEPATKAWQHSRVVALTEADADHAQLVAQAATALSLALPPYRLRTVEEQDWVRLTQTQFEPIHIGQRLWVVPSWHTAPDPDAIVLALDPGMAFGTGSHPTTRLCMEWLEQHTGAGVSVLDYGCGSGILAIVAQKMGAGEVIGVDIDAQAIESAQDNAQRNHASIAFYQPDDFSAVASGKRFDIVVANILSNPLKVMAPLLASRLAAGGALILSGVLARQAEEVIAAYATLIPLSVWAEQDGWVALTGQLPA